MDKPACRVVTLCSMVINFCDVSVVHIQKHNHYNFYGVKTLRIIFTTAIKAISLHY